MLLSLIALLVTSFDASWTSLKTGWDSLLADPGGFVIPEEPTTLKLAFSGAITIAVYALLTGYRRRRRDIARVRDATSIASERDVAPVTREAA